MANKYFKQFYYSLEQMPVELFGRVKRTGATAGTAVYSVEDGKGISSFARNDEGEYEIILDDKYFALLHASFTLIAADALTHSIQIEEVDLNAKSIKFFIVDAADAEIDLPDGAEILVNLSLRNSSK